MIWFTAFKVRKLPLQVAHLRHRGSAASDLDFSAKDTELQAHP